MPDLVAFRAEIDVTCRGEKTLAGDLAFYPENVPTIRMLVEGGAIKRTPEFDDLAPQGE